MKVYELLYEVLQVLDILDCPKQGGGTANREADPRIIISDVDFCKDKDCIQMHAWFFLFFSLRFIAVYICLHCSIAWWELVQVAQARQLALAKN